MTALERARREWLLRVKTRLTELGGRKIRSSRTRREQTEQQSLSEDEGEGDGWKRGKEEGEHHRRRHDAGGARGPANGGKLSLQR